MKECKCTFVQKVLGDGCSICNPQLVISILEEEVRSLQQDMLHLYNALDTIKWWSSVEGDGWDNAIDAVRDCIKKDYL